MRLIDADALKKHIQDDYNDIYKNYPDDLDAKNYLERYAALRKKEVGEMCDWLFGFLTDKYTITDVSPVKRGHWNIRGNYIECSECKQGKVVVDLPVPDYCEHCGAKNL